jgi:hypothetical protein
VDIVIQRSDTIHALARTFSVDSGVKVLEGSAVVMCVHYDTEILKGTEWQLLGLF